MATLFKRRKPSKIDACITLMISLEKPTSGELASLRIAAENAVSERIRSQSSRKDVSVPAIRFSACNAIAGNGGRLSNAHRSSNGAAAFALSTARNIITAPPRSHERNLNISGARRQQQDRGGGTSREDALPVSPDSPIGTRHAFHE